MCNASMGDGFARVGGVIGRPCASVLASSFVKIKSPEEKEAEESLALSKAAAAAVAVSKGGVPSRWAHTHVCVCSFLRFFGRLH